MTNARLRARAAALASIVALPLAACGSGGGAQADAAIDAALDAASEAAPADAALPRFSFFVTSLVAMRRVSGSANGFGGDLRHGEATGLAGADKICREIAETSQPDAGAKGWHAFLSASAGSGAEAVNAMDRIGGGPWYDRLGRLVAADKTALLGARPVGADPAILNDLPNEDGVPNHRPDPTQPPEDNHHVLTGSDPQGKLYELNAEDATCLGWTSTAPTAGRPRVGFSWPLQTRTHWISGQDEGGCGAGVSTDGAGGPSDPDNPIVGSGGGYGAIYCFADTP